MTPFVTHDLLKPSFLYRILKRNPRANAILCIENLLAAKPVRSVTIEEIETIAIEHHLRIKSDMRDDCSLLYAKYLRYCLTDKHISEKEQQDLAHLKLLFQLPERDTIKIHDDITKRIYSAAVDEVLADKRLDDKEEAFLEELKTNIRMNESLAKSVWKEKVFSLLDNTVQQAIADERLSPDEDDELHAICKSLHIDMSVEDATQKLLDKYRLYWQIENEELPEIPVQIRIQKSEHCYFAGNCNWFEQRRVTKRINYGGPTMRIKIAKGLYWRMGSLAVQPVSEESWRLIDEGEFYLTNKRLIFMGASGNKTIRLTKILDFTAYQNGIEIQKDTGKSPFLEFSDGADLFAMILGRAISDA